MAGGAPGNMHPAQVAEAIRQMNGQMPSQEYRPGIDDAAPPPAGWAPPPLPPELAAEIAAGGGEVPPDLAAPGPARPVSVGQFVAVPRNPATMTDDELRQLGALPAPPRAALEWAESVQLRALRIAPTENGLALDLETGDGVLRLIEEEADVIFDVLLKAVTRGMEERLKMLRQQMFAPKRNLLDAEKPQEESAS